MSAALIEKIDLIRRVPLFRRMDRRESAELMKYIDRASVKAGAVLRREGEKAVDLIFIVEGQGHIEKNGQYIDAVGEGDFFGEASVSQSGYEPFTVIADTPMIVLSVHQWYVHHIMKYLHDSPERMKLGRRYLKKSVQLANN